MIDFEKELEGFEPIAEIDDIEDEIAKDDLEDVLDILKAISEK